MAERQRVMIVVDRTIGYRLTEFASSRHVWVVESPTNTPAIRQVWDSVANGDESDPLGPGVTSFVADESEAGEEMCARIAVDVAEHHAAVSHDVAQLEVEIIGVPLSPPLRRALENLGGTGFRQTPEGFAYWC